MNEIDELKEAIEHCREVELECSGSECSRDHQKLRMWLEELLDIKTSRMKVGIVCSGRQTGRTAEMLKTLGNAHALDVVVISTDMPSAPSDLTNVVPVNPPPPIPGIDILPTPKPEKSYQPWRDKKRYF